jgi:hypothetical protein
MTERDLSSGFNHPSGLKTRNMDHSYCVYSMFVTKSTYLAGIIRNLQLPLLCPVHCTVNSLLQFLTYQNVFSTAIASYETHKLYLRNE